MSDKYLQARHMQKHDIEANWEVSGNFVPMPAEWIVYDIDENYTYPRLKIGDGVTSVNNLPFVIMPPDWNQTDETAPDYIKNKPEFLSHQEQSDWSQSDETATDYIKNKPFGDNSDGTVTQIDDKYLSIVDGGKIKGEYLPDDIAGSNYPIVDGVPELQPDTYYVFGEVDELAVTLAEVDDGTLHEYCFEFTASENFTGLTITPTPNWANHPQCVPGKTHQVTVLRGIGVMVCA